MGGRSGPPTREYSLADCRRRPPSLRRAPSAKPSAVGLGNSSALRIVTQRFTKGGSAWNSRRQPVRNRNRHPPDPPHLPCPRGLRRPPCLRQRPARHRPTTREPPRRLRLFRARVGRGGDASRLSVPPASAPARPPAHPPGAPCVMVWQPLPATRRRRCCCRCSAAAPASSRSSARRCRPSRSPPPRTAGRSPRRSRGSRSPAIRG